MRREGSGPQAPGGSGRPAQHRPAPASLLQMMLRNRRTSLQELRSHENFLTRLNGELGRNIQDMEDSAAQKVRAMLQQQDIFAVRPRGAPQPRLCPLRCGPAQAPPSSALGRPLLPSPGLSRPVTQAAASIWKMHLLHALPHLPGLWNQIEMGASSQRQHLLAGNFALTSEVCEMGHSSTYPKVGVYLAQSWCARESSCSHHQH